MSVCVDPVAGGPLPDQSSVTQSGSRIDILTLEDRAWWERLESDAAPSQCWRYAYALTHSGYEPRLAVVSTEFSRLRLPFCERRWGEHLDIATLPGLSGASVVPTSEAPLNEWSAYARARGWLAGYIQMSADTYPNVPCDAGAIDRMHVFFVNPAEWDLHRSASANIRQKVARAARAGATIVEERDLLAARLCELYPATLAKFGVQPLLSSATITSWAADPHNLLLGVAVHGSVEAVHLIHLHERHAELHLAGVTDRGRELSAFLYARGIERLRESGVTRCNLGGGGNPGDGLFRFKSWLGARPVPLQCIHQIYDVPRYEAVCLAAGVETDARWFPAYRSRSFSRRDIDSETMP